MVKGFIYEAAYDCYPLHISLSLFLIFNPPLTESILHILKVSQWIKGSLMFFFIIILAALSLPCEMNIFANSCPEEV